MTITSPVIRELVAIADPLDPANTAAVTASRELVVSLGASGGGNVTIAGPVGAGAAATAVRTTLASDDALTGAVNETAPATDTASSGLNGRLQRIAQRLTTLIAFFASGIGTVASAIRVTDAENMASTATDLSLTSTAASQTLSAANAARKGMFVTNTDANNCRVAYAATASATVFTVLIPPGGYWEMPKPIYTGLVTAIWDADGSGSLIGSEMS